MAVEMFILITFIATFFYNLGACTFQDGYISGGNELFIGITETEDDCANLVRAEMANSEWEEMGATYEPKTKNCVAEYASFKMRTYSSSYYRYCLFAGMSFYDV